MYLFRPNQSEIVIRTKASLKRHIQRIEFGPAVEIIGDFRCRRVDMHLCDGYDGKQDNNVFHEL